jgi:hypothetical protein
LTLSSKITITLTIGAMGGFPRTYHGSVRFFKLYLLTYKSGGSVTVDEDATFDELQAEISKTHSHIRYKDNFVGSDKLKNKGITNGSAIQLINTHLMD